MLALEILVNGEKYKTVGAEDWGGIDAHLFAFRRDERTKFSFDASVHLQQAKKGEWWGLRWRNRELQPGDEVTIRIVETPTVDEPDRRYRCDSTVQESPHTEEERLEFAREQYEHLKKMFEPND